MRETLLTLASTHESRAARQREQAESFARAGLATLAAQAQREAERATAEAQRLRQRAQA